MEAESKNQLDGVKSVTQYPKNMQPCMITSEDQETNDDLATREMLSGEKDTENNDIYVKSVSSNPIIDIQTQNVSASEVKVEIETKEDVRNGNIKIMPSQTNNCDINKSINGHSFDEQPLIIFNTSKLQTKQKNGKKNNQRQLSKKKQYTGDIRNIHFKYKHPKINIATKLEKFYGKKRKNTAYKFKPGLYSSSITNIVSKTRILRKVLGQENLLNIPDHALMWDDDSLNETDTSSRSLTLSVAPKSVLSYSSQDTLRRASIDSSEPSNSVDFVNSVVKVPSENNVPFKVDVLSVAVAYNFKPNTNKKVNKKEYTQKILLTENITSATSTKYDERLTSESSITTERDQIDEGSKSCKCEISNETLIATATSSHEYGSNNEMLFIVKSSSHLEELSFNSTLTLKSSSDNTDNSDPLSGSLASVTAGHKLTSTVLLDTVVNFSPDVNPPITSKVDIVYDYQESKDLPCVRNPKNRSEISDLPTTILQKPCFLQEQAEVQKSINLPNENVIKILLEGTKDSQSKLGTTQFSKYPTTLPELWNRIVVVLDLSMKKLEESLTEKFIREISKLLPLSEKLTRPIPDLVINDNAPVQTPVVETKLHKQIQAEKKTTTADQSHQHDSKIQIDYLLLKPSVNRITPHPSSSSSRNVKKPKLLKEIIEVLKPPVFENIVADLERGDSVNIATEISVEDAAKYQLFSRMKYLVLIPVRFVKENMFVLVAVPLFFTLLLCIYALIVFSIQK